MIYVFEDNRLDPLPQLFMKAYDESISSQFIYTEGNGNLEHEITKLLEETKEEILIYLDVIPVNREITKLYKKLRYLSRKYNYRVIVLPILGAEYYFIKSIKDENVWINKMDINTCVNREPYFDSSLVKNNIKYVTTYERYCKLILKTAVLDCIVNSEKEGQNQHFRCYYNNDCLCQNPLTTDCREKELLKKAVDLLLEYPCFPGGSYVQGKQAISTEEIWQKHRDLIDDYNKLSDKLKNADPNVSRVNLYQHLDYIK